MTIPRWLGFGLGGLLFLSAGFGSGIVVDQHVLQGGRLAQRHVTAERGRGHWHGHGRGGRGGFGYRPGQPGMPGSMPGARRAPGAGQPPFANPGAPNAPRRTAPPFGAGQSPAPSPSTPA